MEDGARPQVWAGGRLFALVVFLLAAGVTAVLGVALPSGVDASAADGAVIATASGSPSGEAPAGRPDTGETSRGADPFAVRGTSTPTGSDSSTSDGPASDGVASAELAVPPSPAVPTTVKVPILMYHYVNKEPPPAGPYADSLTVRTHEFEEQMAFLAENGYTVISLPELTAAQQGAALPEKPVILTFDDGGADNYTVAFPILRRHGFTATFFVITGKVGTEGYMTWEQLKEMDAAGMTIGSHTVSHPDLTGVGVERLDKELNESCEEILRRVGTAPTAFCYPSGAFNGTVIEAVERAGYHAAVTTKPGKEAKPDAPFELPRVRMRPFVPVVEFARLLQ